LVSLGILVAEPMLQRKSRDGAAHGIDYHKRM
jgi:hypothetical protein